MARHSIERTQAPERSGPSGEARCPICFGTGFRVAERPGGRSSAATVCECRRARRASELMKLARIPRRYESCSFGTFLPQDASQESALAQTRAFVDSYTVLKVQDEVEFGLLFLGPPGVGKTHLSVAALRSLILEQGIPGLFADFRDLLKELQASYDPVSQTSEMDVLRPLLQTEVLVLDDLGAARMTEWVRDLVGHIVNTRYNDRRVTIITTNLADEEPVGRRGDGGESARRDQGSPAAERAPKPGDRTLLVDRIGSPVRSRLHEMCLTIRLLGEDYRQKLKASTRTRLR
ncbi:MAG: ATP-binding protein [Acidobacteria bacterium]|nr:ATP-binding protein [Acidobacteriota bacterium]